MTPPVHNHTLRTQTKLPASPVSARNPQPLSALAAPRQRQRQPPQWKVIPCSIHHASVARTRNASNLECGSRSGPRVKCKCPTSRWRVFSAKDARARVLLVRHKGSSDLYAPNAIPKRHVLSHQVLQHTLTEQAVLRRMAAKGTDSFVVQLWWSFHILVMVRTTYA